MSPSRGRDASNPPSYTQRKLSQPWVAVLEKETRGAWLLWILGFVFGGLGALGLLYYIGKVFLLGWLLRSESKTASGPPSLPPTPPASGPPPLPPGD